MKPAAILDTCVLVDILRNKKADLQDKLNALDIRRCAIADLTIFELLCGAEKSSNKERNLNIVKDLVAEFQVLPTSCGYRLAAQEKVRLQLFGTPIGDIDLLIGCACSQTAIPLVTNNRRHLERITGLTILEW